MGFIDNFTTPVQHEDTVTTKSRTTNRLFEKGEFAAPEIGHLLRGDLDKLQETQIGRGLLSMFYEAAETPTDHTTQTLGKLGQLASQGTADPFKVAEAAAQAEATGGMMTGAERIGRFGPVAKTEGVAQSSQITRAKTMQNITSTGKQQQVTEAPSGFERFLATAGFFLPAMAAWGSAKPAGEGTTTSGPPAAPSSFGDIAYGQLGYQPSTAAYRYEDPYSNPNIPPELNTPWMD